MLHCLWALVLVAQPLTFAATTQPPVQDPGIINRDSACEVTKGCYPGPDECSSDCIYLITWHQSGGDEYTFTISGKADPVSWGGIGLSSDRKMGDSSVMVCKSWDGTVVAESSYNTPGNSRKNEPLTDPSYGITTISGSYADGVLRCEFTRKISADHVTGGKQKDANRFFDIEENWYMLVSHGIVDVVSGVKQKHNTELYPPIVSPGKIDFQNVQSPVVTTVAPAPGA